MSFNFAYGPVDVFQGLDMDAFLRRMQSSALPVLAGGGTAAGGGTISPIMAPSPEVISGIIPDPNAGSASGVIPDRNPDGSPIVGHPEMFDRLPAIALPGILEPVNLPTGNELPIGPRPPLPGDPGYDPGIEAGIAGMIPATTVNPPSFTNIDDYLAGIVSLKPGPIGSNLDYDLLLRERQSSPLPEKTEAEMKAQQFMAQKAPTSEAVTTTRSSSSGSGSSGSGSSGSEGIPSLRQMIFERYQPLVSQQRNYQSYIG